ncbi:hypothetical protein LOTGIDRAFT_157290 [Lottia gigantea]|uniref:Uncharacterized protein n=1 Tax=Lottia gigantea TaxID=225164 RepID=V4ADP9_LOTGI|nr:hypothetical protein LOTGIDRAFT_157290 [Lottia gigantea]ESP02139.1 hypothetical protein LOTGIDRAFT_157290 [Lottia gigantea]
MALLTKQNLRIGDEIKDMVQNKILKKRGMLKQINGLLDKNQPKIEVYFSKCNSSANSRSRSSSRLKINDNNSKLTDTSPEKSPQNNSGTNVETDLYCLMHSPETRSFKRRLESGFNSSVKKNIFNTSVNSKLIPSENYSAIPTMLISPDCLSIKRSLKETINNSRIYRSQSPASSDSSTVDSKDTTPRRVTRSHVVDNDENSHDSITSVRSSSRLKSVLKAANFKA